MITISKIAELVNGEVIGDAGLKIKGMAPPAFAGDGDITFAFGEKGLQEAEQSGASCVLTEAGSQKSSKTLLRVENMKLAMTVLYNAMLEVKPPEKGVAHPSAVIAKSAILGKNVAVGPNAVIGENARVGDNSSIGANCTIGKNVSIGENACLYPNVTVYDHMIIGNKVTIHSGTVIGADGFGYIPKDGKIYKVPQMGAVVIEDNVEIGANTCIDRGTFMNTSIGRGSKIDNLVQMAHNVKVGKNVLIAGQVGIAGSAVIGDNVMMGGQGGVADHCIIGKDVKMGAQCGVSGKVKDNEVLLRYPARTPLEVRTLDRIQSALIKNAKKFRKFLKSLPEAE